MNKKVSNPPPPVGATERPKPPSPPPAPQSYQATIGRLRNELRKANSTVDQMQEILDDYEDAPAVKAERDEALSKLADRERIIKEWQDLWMPIDDLVRPMTALGKHVSTKALEMLKEHGELKAKLTSEKRSPDLYRRVVHAGWPEWSEDNIFSDGNGGGEPWYRGQPAVAVPDGWNIVTNDNWNIVTNDNWNIPRIGQRVILFSNGVVQQESYTLDQADGEPGCGYYFWDRDDLDVCPEVKAGDMWISWPDAVAPPHSWQSAVSVPTILKIIKETHERNGFKDDELGCAMRDGFEKALDLLKVKLCYSEGNTLSASPEPDSVKADPVLEFLSISEKFINDHPFLYVEIARTRVTDWMVWLRKKPDGELIASGEGLSAAEACEDALKMLEEI